MRTIFFDFETSSRDPLGQILSYSFICVDNGYNVIEELNGLIRPNRTQFPDIDAILTNKLNLDYLIQHGETDYNAAKRIYDFLETYCSYGPPITLVGYNSNSFDLTFLRNLLISYGYNPYFKGKLQNKDVLHYVQFLAFQNPNSFPWVRTERNASHYYSFKLEDLAMSFRLLSAQQSHNAREDVILTINLVRTLEMHFKYPFKDFNPTAMLSNTQLKNGMIIGKQKKKALCK
jgi:exonuclease I